MVQTKLHMQKITCQCLTVHCPGGGPITAVLPHVKKRLQSLLNVGQMCSVTLLSIQAGKTVNQNVLRAN